MPDEITPSAPAQAPEGVTPEPIAQADPAPAGNADHDPLSGFPEGISFEDHEESPAEPVETADEAHEEPTEDEGDDGPVPFDDVDQAGPTDGEGDGYTPPEFDASFLDLPRDQAEARARQQFEGFQKVHRKNHEMTQTLGGYHATEQVLANPEAFQAGLKDLVERVATLHGKNPEALALELFGYEYEGDDAPAEAPAPAAKVDIAAEVKKALEADPLHREIAEERAKRAQEDETRKWVETKGAKLAADVNAHRNGPSVPVTAEEMGKAWAIRDELAKLFPEVKTDALALMRRVAPEKFVAPRTRAKAEPMIDAKGSSPAVSPLGPDSSGEDFVKYLHTPEGRASISR